MTECHTVTELYRHKACMRTVGTDEFDIEPTSTPLYARLKGECPRCGSDSPIVCYETYITKPAAEQKTRASD